MKKCCAAHDWVQLAKFVMSRLILFNKGRRAEVRELKVSEYLARPNWKQDESGEMALALSVFHLLTVYLQRGEKRSVKFVFTLARLLYLCNL